MGSEIIIIEDEHQAMDKFNPTNTVEEHREGLWVQVYKGLKCWPLDMREGDVDIEIIAHALAMKCRYGGHVKHTKLFYSVAQHSVALSYLVPGYAFEALMHDTPEAIIDDMVRPMKKMFTDYCALEDAILKVFAQQFGFMYPMPEEVIEADLRIIDDERKQLLDPMDVPPEVWGNAIPGFGINLLPTLPPCVAKRLFLQRYEELKS